MGSERGNACQRGQCRSAGVYFSGEMIQSFHETLEWGLKPPKLLRNMFPKLKELACTGPRPVPMCPKGSLGEKANTIFCVASQELELGVKFQAAQYEDQLFE